MATINQQLLKALQNKTGLSLPHLYARIKQTADGEYLPRHLAAIKVAAESGVTINKYASPEELAELRLAGSPVAPPSIAQPDAQPPNRGKNVAKNAKAKGRGTITPNQVFVVHGRDAVAKAAMFAFLRAVGVKPIEWNVAISMTKKSSPYVGEILQAAFSQARAVVVLLTPDDWAQLRDDLLSPDDPPFERRHTGQARPNVLFEAGMAFSSHPDRTVLVQIGNLRPFSDTAGRHILHMSNDATKRKELATKLMNAGCGVDIAGTDWLNVGDFSDPETRAPKKSLAKSKKSK